MSTVFLHNVNNNASGFTKINQLLNDARSVSGDRVVLRMMGSWFNASMSAALYVILKHIQQSYRVGIHKNRNAKVERILSKNGFFPYLVGSVKSYDTYGTTIPFKRFHPYDEEVFEAYVNSHVTHHRSFPAASEALRSELGRSLLELFTNAVLHAETQHGIVSCGQFFPNKSRLEFCLADAGVGIRANVEKVMGGITDESAIFWAMQKGNTTKSPEDKVPGGLGLKLLMRFVKLNGGRLMMVSGHGFYELNTEGEHLKRLRYPFPGTAAYLQICTDDTGYYLLEGEVPSEDDIF